MVFQRENSDTSTDGDDVPQDSGLITNSKEAPAETSSDLKRHNANDVPTSPKKVKLDFSLFKSIDNLDDIISNFTLCLRIRNISPERYIKVGNKSMSIFHADGFDKNGHGIRIIFTDAMVKRWECQIDVNDVYQFKGFKLRPCNVDYNNLGSLYEIDITKNTTIDNVPVNNPKICPISTNFVNLIDIDEIPAGQCIDVIGYITQINDPVTLTSKSSNKNDLVKTDMYIEDQTGRIMVTFWNLPKEIIYEVGTFFVIYSCNVNEFRNEKNLNVNASSVVDVDANIDNLKCLKTYYDNKINRKKDKKKKNH